MYLLMPLSCISSSDAESVGAIFATTAVDGKTDQVEYYNLDMSMSVGYRVKSKRGVQFRRWSNVSRRDREVLRYEAAITQLPVPKAMKKHTLIQYNISFLVLPNLHFLISILISVLNFLT